MKKTKYTTILWAIAVVALVAAAVFLVADRIAGTAFSDVVPNTEKFEACQIFCIKQKSSIQNCKALQNERFFCKTR